MELEYALSAYEKFLVEEEKSRATIEKYLRDVRCFLTFRREHISCKSEILEEKGCLGKENVLSYKAYLTETYAPASVNSMLIALNGFLRFVGHADCCVKPLRIQRQIFCQQERELTKTEYQRLVDAARGKRIGYIIQTICATGIRVSELRYITVEAVREGKAVVNCKNKRRVIFIPAALQKFLKAYMGKCRRKSGPIFVSKNGNPLNRSNIWREMKALCKASHVRSEKVFPHNLRHLFARTFYAMEKDIVRLADLLGHSSVNTTRIYTMETGNRHILRLERVQKLLIT